MKCIVVLALAACGTPSGAVDSGPGHDATERDSEGDGFELIDAQNDAPIDAPPDLEHLSGTGLCLDARCTMIAPGISAFLPRWALWSDGATKKRWIQLPAGAQIDTSNMDYWSFPVGTKIWKEFKRDGVRVETRFMMRTGPRDSDWMFMPYAWNAAQNDAVATPNGMPDANNTMHDIPSVGTCHGCHDNVKSHVLGFSAFQLDYNAAPAYVDLEDAIAKDWLSAPPPGSRPRLPLPGNASEQAALGYLNTNCGHCHNSDSPLINRPMFRLEVGYVDTLDHTRTYASSVNVDGQPFGGATKIAVPGDPDHSIIITRTNATDPAKRMPALGSEVIDPAGQTLLRSWITNL